MDVDDLIGTERGQDLDRKAACLDLFVVFQAVRRVVGGADHLDVRPLHQSSCRIAFGLQEIGAAVEDAVGALGGQGFVDAEIARQFQVRPMVERVADAIRDGFGKRPELLPPGRVPGDVPFVNAERAHGSPLIVVAREHDLAHVRKAVVPGDLLRVEMAMVIDDGLALGKGMVERLRGLVLQEKVLVDNGFHSVTPSLKMEISR